MLIELKDVEAFVQPDEILTQALREGDISISSVISTCISEEGIDEVLKVFDEDAIVEFVHHHNIRAHIGGLDDILESLEYLNETEKAKLLWYLLKYTKEKIA